MIYYGGNCRYCYLQPEGSGRCTKIMNVTAAYDELATEIEELGVTKSNMFGMPVLKLRTKPILRLVEDGINFKLKQGTSAFDEALKLEGAYQFRPSMHGKDGPLMKQWIVLPMQHQARYLEFAQESFKFVESETK